MRNTEETILNTLMTKPELNSTVKRQFDGLPYLSQHTISGLFDCWISPKVEPETNDFCYYSSCKSPIQSPELSA